MVWLAIGLPLSVWGWISYRVSSPRPRQVVRRLIPAFVGLVFFAVFIDVFAIFAAFQWNWTGRIYYAMNLLEMAGELAGLSAVLLVPLGYVLRHHQHGRHLDMAAHPSILRRGAPTDTKLLVNAHPKPSRFADEPDAPQADAPTEVRQLN